MRNSSTSSSGKSMGGAGRDTNSVSRRAFIEIAVGSIAALPAAAGGFVSPFGVERAYAADDASTSNSSTVVIAKRTEAGFVVADVTDNKKAPVAGAEVTVTSCYNGKKVTGKTGKDGSLLIDITGLAEKVVQNGTDTYSFYAKVEMNAEGYRYFRTGRIFVEGAKGLYIPTRKNAGERVYPACVSLDDWDALYTTNEFAVTSANDTKHTFAIELRTAARTPVEVAIVDPQGKKVATGTATPRNTVATCELTGYFLLSTHKSALPVGQKLSLAITCEGTDYRVPLSLATVAAPTGASAPSSTKLTLSPFNMGGMLPQIEIPASVPVIGGTNIRVWTPDLPIQVMFNPFGYFFIAYRSEEFGYKSKDGKYEGDAWKKHPRKTFADQWKKAADDREAMGKKVGAAIKDRESTFQNVSFTKAISATAMLSGALAGRWSSESALWRGMASVQGTLAFNFSMAQQFMAGPVPLVLEFSLLSSLSLGLSVAVATPEVFTPSKYTLDYTNTGVSMTIGIKPAISLGVGVKGVLSASVQGMFNLTLFVNCGPLPAGRGKEISNPHIVLGMKASVNVVVQALIFTVTRPLWTPLNEPALYDNWKSSSVKTSALATQAEPSWDTFMDGATIIGEDDIGAVSEFELLDWEETKVEVNGEVAEAETLWGDEDAYSEDDDDEGWYCWGDGVDVQGDDSEFLDWDGADDEWEGSAFIVDGIYDKESGWSEDDGNGADDADAWVLKTASGEQRVTGMRVQGAGTGALVAGASPALGAQAATEGGVRRRRRAKVTENGRSAYTTTRPDPTGPAKLAGDSGLVPSCDKRLMSQVFSDPRVKAVQIFGDTYVFRIASVDIKSGNDTKKRTRIVCQKLKGTSGTAEPMRVIDFDPKYGYNPDIGKRPTRDELFDYDFDVAVEEWSKKLDGEGTSLHFFIISGRRAAGDKTTIGQVASDQVFTYAVWKFKKGSPDASIAFAFSSQTDSKYFAVTGKACTYHNFSCPHIERISDTFTRGVETTPSSAYVLTYLDRGANSTDKVLGSDGASVGVGVLFAHDGEIYSVETSQLIGKFVDDVSIYEMVTLDRTSATGSGSDTGDEFKSTSGHHVVMLRGNQKVYYSLLETTAASNASGWPRLMAVKPLAVADADGNEPQRLVAWPGHDELLASVGGKLKRAALADLAGSPRLSYTECGPSDFAIDAFGTDTTGSFIYWPASYEGSPGFSYDPSSSDPSATAKSLAEVERHRVMACKLRAGAFSDPFVFAEVEHDMDTLAAIGTQGSEAMAFISTDLRDASKGAADIWYTSMPNVKCANVIGCEAASRYVYPETPTLFYLTVRNEGNTHLSGFTARLHQKGNAKVESQAKVTFSASSLVESSFNPKGSDGKLQNAEDDYSLAPGKTAVYQIEIPIPKGWTGEKEVCVTATGATVASTMKATAQDALSTQEAGATEVYDDSDAVEYVVGTDTDDYGEEGAPFDLFDVLGRDDLDDADTSDEDALEDAPLIERGDVADDDSNRPASHPDGRPGASTPTTGDRIDSWGIAGSLALAAAASAIGAYSKRRAENERGASRAEE